MVDATITLSSPPRRGWAPCSPEHTQHWSVLMAPNTLVLIRVCLGPRQMRTVLCGPFAGESCRVMAVALFDVSYGLASILCRGRGG